MKRIALGVLGLSLFLGVFLTCQKKSLPQVQATVYLFFASHLEGEDIIPLFRGETSVQTIQAVLKDKEEISRELQKTFGYTRIQLEDFQKFLLEKEKPNINYFFRLGNYFIRLITLKNGHRQGVPLSLTLFSSEHMNLSTNLSPQDQLNQAALQAREALPLLRVRVTVPLNESVILGKAIAPEGEQAFFVVIQLQSIEGESKSKAIEETGNLLVYTSESELRALVRKNKKLRHLVEEDTIPNVRPFYELSVKPRVIKRPQIPYPESLREKGIEDRVIVKVLIDEQGRVIRTQIIKPSKYQELNEVAEKAAREFVFEPGIAFGKPVKVWMTIPFSFRLKKETPK